MWRGLKTARCERCDRGGGETQMRSCFITVRTVGGRRGGGGVERPTERPQSGWRGVSVQTLKETDRKTRCIDLKSRESAFSSPSILAQAVGICTQTVHVTVATSVLLRPIQRGGESLSNRWPSDSIANNFSWLSRAAPSVQSLPPPTPNAVSAPHPSRRDGFVQHPAVKMNEFHPGWTFWYVPHRARASSLRVNCRWLSGRRGSPFYS